MTLLDLLTVWETESDMIEMEQFGLSILLEYAAQGDINVSDGAKKEKGCTCNTLDKKVMSETGYCILPSKYHWALTWDILKR